jgi:hypothetical protein
MNLKDIMNTENLNTFNKGEASLKKLFIKNFLIDENRAAAAN